MIDSETSTLDLIKMHAQTLYVHDELSRIISINDWNGGIAPRFYLGRTQQGNIWRFRSDLPEELSLQLASLCKSEPPAISGRPAYEAEYLSILSAHSAIKQIWFGPAYYFADGITASPDPIPIHINNSSFLRDELQDWVPDVPYQQPFVAIIVDGLAVALCASVRISSTAHEAGVETASFHRRKGYAVKVVSAWAGAVKAIGAVPLYSTSIENIASQKVAARLGLTRYGLDFHVT
jgi:RimJ/RimL family protein N-acetyltransferase